jgi:hypothetical protein
MEWSSHESICICDAQGDRNSEFLFESDQIVRGSEKVKRESELRTMDGGRGRESHRTTEIGKPRVTRPEGEACHPQDRRPSSSPSRVPTRESHETRSTGNAERTTASSSSGGPPVSAVSPTSSMPSPKDVTMRHTHAPHAIKLSDVATNIPQQHQVLSLLEL